MLALDMPQTDCIIILPRKWFMIYVAAKQCARAEYLGEKYMEIKSCVSNLVAFLIQNEKGWSCGDLYSSLCYKSTVCFQHLISIGQLIYWGCFILSHCLQRRSEVKGECRGKGCRNPVITEVQWGITHVTCFPLCRFGSLPTTYVEVYKYVVFRSIASSTFHSLSI